MTAPDRKEFEKAREAVARLIVQNEHVIKVLTAFEANKARRVVREAGHGHR